MKLDAGTLSSVLSRMTLNINHDGILNAILAWYEYSKETREDQVGGVLQAFYRDLDVQWSEMKRSLPELRAKIKELSPPERGQRDVIMACGGVERIRIGDNDR